MERLIIEPHTRVLVLTGAGVSAESGVPTFRGQDGLWEGLPVEEVASPEGFARNPALVWRFYGLRRQAAATVTPNAGHTALAALEGQLGERFLLTTQNVDGLHARAGSRRVIAMHGELFMSRCVACAVPFDDPETYLGRPLPTCATCGQPVRPHIVWFGEQLERAHIERIARFMDDAGSRLLFIAVGTSGNVFPAAAFVDEARLLGGRTLLIDSEPAEHYARRFDTVIAGKSGAVLPALFTWS